MADTQPTPKASPAPPPTDKPLTSQQAHQGDALKNQAQSSEPAKGDHRRQGMLTNEEDQRRLPKPDTKPSAHPQFQSLIDWVEKNIPGGAERSQAVSRLREAWADCSTAIERTVIAEERDRRNKEVATEKPVTQSPLHKHLLSLQVDETKRDSSV